MVKRLVIVLALLAVVFGGMFGLKVMQMQQMAAMLSAPRPPAVIPTVQVARERWQPTLHAIGSLVAVNGTNVTTEVAGIVQALHFRSGQPIQAGEPLLQLDAAVDRATLAGLKADRRLAKVELDRFSDLIQRKAVSKSDYDAAVAKYDAQAARVVEQEAKIAQKTLRAPFDGLLGIRQVNLGQYLPPGAPVVAIQALDPIYVDYSLPERHFSELAVGQRVEIEVDAWPGEVFQGTVSALEAEVDRGTRALKVRATLANPDGRLRPGMFAEVETLRPEQLEVLTIPRTAVSFNTYGNYVYIIEQAEDQLIAKRRQVETGAVREGRIVVTTGVEAGDEVVRAGLVKLRDGQPVQVDNSVELNDAEVPRE